MAPALGQRVQRDIFPGCSRHEIHHAGRQPGILKNFSQLEARDRRGLGWLEHNRVTHRECGREFPRQHQQGKIPRNHLPNDAEWDNARARGHVLQLVRPARMIKEMRGRHRHIEIA